MRTNTGLIVGLVVSVLLAAVFAVLWFGAQEDNKLLTRQVIWMNVMSLSRSSYVGYYFYVVIDTYNVVEAVDRRLGTTTPFNVIYIDGVTKLP